MNLEAVRKKLYGSAGYIRFWLTKQPGVKEESITDWLLFDVSNQLSNVARCKNQQIVQNDGVFIAGAQQIHDSFVAGRRQKVTSADLLKLSSPFSCVACYSCFDVLLSYNNVMVTELK